MSNIDLSKYFLCGIGINDEIRYFKVGRYDQKRESFSFENGSYSPVELYANSRGANAIRIISAVSLEDIDNAGLIHKELV